MDDYIVTVDDIPGFTKDVYLIDLGDLYTNIGDLLNVTTHIDNYNLHLKLVSLIADWNIRGEKDTKSRMHS